MLKAIRDAEKAGFATMERYAETIANSQRAAAPVEAGALRNSIKVTSDGKNVVHISAGGEATTRPVRQGASATVDYALAQEFGTQKMPANPFFWPSYRLLRKPMRSAVKRAMAKAAKANFQG